MRVATLFLKRNRRKRARYQSGRKLRNPEAKDKERRKSAYSCTIRRGQTGTR